MRVSILGVGLIGGSIGLAARAKVQGAHVTGFGRSPERLERARALGAIDEAAASLDDAVASADVCFCCAPVGALTEQVSGALGAAGPECVVSDVGSTKAGLVAAVDDPRFVGGHPLAGAETAGVENARADLFAGATWYLTPTSSTAGVGYERLHRLISAFGALPAAIDADTHDRLLAGVSHLPHVLANVLVSHTAEAVAREGETLPATGPSFRDATRVAGANSEMWTDIYLANREALIGGIDDTVARLQRVREALASADAGAITGWNDAAAADRRTLLEGHLTGGPVHELRVSVPNRPGVIAELALELGRAGINIVDMALHPAPDNSEGLVALWIGGDESADRAAELVAGLGHPVARA